MDKPTLPANEDDDDRRRRSQQARTAYDQARERVRVARTPAGGTPNDYQYFVEDVTAAAVEFMLSGLDEWIAASAKASAGAEQRSHEADRRLEVDRADQRRARWTVIALTVVIGIAGAANAIMGGINTFKKPAPIVIPAPIVTVLPAAITVLPAQVTIAPAAVPNKLRRRLR